MQSVMNVFAKFILNPVVRPFVLLFFCVTSTVSLAFMFKLEIGLDQTVALREGEESLVPSFHVRQVALTKVGEEGGTIP